VENRPNQYRLSFQFQFWICAQDSGSFREGFPHIALNLFDMIPPGNSALWSAQIDLVVGLGRRR